MLSSIAKVLLTCTAMAPVGFVYAWAAYWQGEIAPAIVIGFCSFALVPLCIFIMGYARRHLEVMPIKAEAIEPSDKESTAFLLLYLLPLFTDKFDTLNWVVWIPIVAIFAVMTITGYNYHFNPLLGLMRWHFYRLQADGVTYVLITKRHLRSVMGTLRVCQLTEYILIDTQDARDDKSSGRMQD